MGPALAAPVPAVAAAPCSSAAAVRTLRLRGFRNYVDLRLELGPQCVVLTGANGAGKTNLLEAVSLLSPGRGLRGAELAALGRDGRSGWQVEATVDGGDGLPVEVETGQGPAGNRRLLVEGRAVGRRGALWELPPVLWLTPAEDRLLVEGPAGRRRFLDRLVLTLDPGHAPRLGAYERSLRERAVLLRQPRPDPLWLGTLERRIAELAVAVAAARRQLVGALGGYLEAADPFPRPALALEGEVESWLTAGPALAAEDRLADALAAARPADARLGGAGHGVHRSDLVVGDAARGTAGREASTGRQRLLLLAILLAQARLLLARRGQLPVLLFDEALAHLDGQHRVLLQGQLLALGAQAWLSGQDQGEFKTLLGASRQLGLEEGRIVE